MDVDPDRPRGGSSSSNHHHNNAVLWGLTVLCGLVLLNDELVTYAPGVFLPQTLFGAGYSTVRISVVMSCIWWTSIATILVQALRTHQAQQQRSGPNSPPPAPLASSVENAFGAVARSLTAPSRRKEALVTLALAMQALSNVACWWWPSSFVVLFGARSVQGVASALAWVFTLSLVCELFPAGGGGGSEEEGPNRNGQALSIVFSLNAVGELVGPLLGGWLVTDFGVATTFLVVGVGSLLLTGVFVVLAFGCPRPTPFPYAALPESGTGAAATVAAAASNAGSGALQPVQLMLPHAMSPIPSRPAMGTGPGAVVVSGALHPFTLVPSSAASPVVAGASAAESSLTAMATLPALTSGTAGTLHSAVVGTAAATAAAAHDVSPSAEPSPHELLGLDPSDIVDDSHPSYQQQHQQLQRERAASHSGGVVSVVTAAPDDADPSLDGTGTVSLSYTSRTGTLRSTKSSSTNTSGRGSVSVSVGVGVGGTAAAYGTSNSLATVSSAPFAAPPAAAGDLTTLAPAEPLEPIDDTPAPHVSPLSDPVVVAMSGMVGLVGVVRTALDVLVPLYLSVALKASAWTIGVVFTLQSVTFVVVTSVVGARLDTRFDIRASIAAFATLLAVLCGLVFWWPAAPTVVANNANANNNGVLVLVPFGAYLCVVGAAMGVTTLSPSFAIAERAKQVPGLSTEAALAAFNLCWFGGYGAGSMVTALIVDPTDAWALHVLFCVLGLVLLLFVPVFLKLTANRVSTAAQYAYNELH